METGTRGPRITGANDPSAPKALGTATDITAARDGLRRLVEQIPAALAEVQRLAASAEAAEWPPPWFGAVTSNRTDTSQRIDELLQPLTVIVCHT